MSLTIGHDEKSLLIRAITLKGYNEETQAENFFLTQQKQSDFTPKTENFIIFHDDYITVGINAEKIDSAAILEAIRIVAENLGKGQEH